MKLVFVIFSLACGGAERVMSSMANYWAKKGWKIAIVTFDSVPPFYRIDSRVKLCALKLDNVSSNFAQGLKNNAKRILTLRRNIVELSPEVVVSFMDSTNVLTLLATRGLNVPVVISERVNPAFHDIGNIWGMLRGRTYLFADKLVVQGREIKEFFSKHLRSKIEIIANPVIRPEWIKKRGETFGKIVAMGRLHRQKGFDLLINAFALVYEKHPCWSLVILGEGSERENLSCLCRELGLENSVAMPGRVDDPGRYLAKSDIFVLSSRYEGFPNALCEAMAHGLPVVATDCPSGPGEIVRNNVDGFLVKNDALSLAEAIEKLVADEKLREQFAVKAIEVAERFALEKIMEKWEYLLQNVFGGAT